MIIYLIYQKYFLKISIFVYVLVKQYLTTLCLNFGQLRYIRQIRIQNKQLNSKNCILPQMNHSQRIQSSYYNSNQPSKQLSAPLSNPNSASLTNHNEDLDEDPNNIRLFDQDKFTAFIQRIEKNVYQKLFQKIVNVHLPKNLIFKKVISSENQFRSEEYLEEINKRITIEIDSFQASIRLNILERDEIVQFKRKVIQREQRKAKKYADIQQLIQKIAQKQKGKKVQQLIQNFAASRKKIYKRFEPNPQIQIQNQRVKNILKKEPCQSQIQIRKTKQFIQQRKKDLQNSTGIKLDKLRKILL